jgi:peptidylprolyl isomerase
MAQAKNGDKVRVHYTGTLEDGSIFDSSEDVEDGCGDESGDHECGCGGNAGGPMEFVIGQGNLIPKFESAVIGLEPGQNIKVTIEADEAYGQRAEEMVAVIERSEIPAEMKPQIGDHLEVIMQDGTPMPVMVTEVTETAITLDANHPLAGMNLTFDIRLVEII